jgi:hypothetical protein
MTEGFRWLVNKSSVWYGDNLDSIYGVGLFSDKFNIKSLEEHNPEFRYIVPYKIFDKSSEFTLFSVWIKPIEKNYEKPLYDGVEYYRNKKCLIIIQYLLVILILLLKMIKVYIFR